MTGIMKFDEPLHNDAVTLCLFCMVLSRVLYTTVERAVEISSAFFTLHSMHGLLRDRTSVFSRYFLIISTSCTGMFYWWCLVYDSTCDYTNESSYTAGSKVVAVSEYDKYVASCYLPGLSRRALERELHYSV